MAATGRSSSRSASAEAPSGIQSKDDQNVVDIVNAIKRKKTFRQLVLYNVQLLEKAVNTGRDRAWEHKAKIAHEAGAAEILLEIVQRFCTTNEILRPSAVVLQSICSFGSYADAVLQSKNIKNLPISLKKSWDMFVNQNALTPDTAETIQLVLDLLKSLATRNVELVASHGGVESVLHISQAASKGIEQDTSARSKSKLMADIVTTGMQFFDYISRSAAGVRAMSVKSQLSPFIEILSVRPSVAPNKTTASAFQARRRSMMPAKAETSAKKTNTAGTSLSKSDILNFLPIGLRVVDRLCRNDEIIALLQECNAVQQLTRVLLSIQDNESLLSLLVRILGRLLKGNISNLVSDILDGGTSNTRERVDEAETSALLLANLVRDEEHTESLLNSSNNTLLKTLCSAFSEVSSRAIKRSIASVFNQVARFSTEAASVLISEEIIEALLSVIGSSTGEAALLSEASTALAALTLHPATCKRIMDARVDTEGGKRSGKDILLGILKHATSLDDGGDSYASLLLLIERLCFFAPLDEELKSFVAEQLSGMLQTYSSNFDLQMIGTDVATYISDNEQTVWTLVDGGILTVIIQNLENDRTSAESSQGLASLEDRARHVASTLYLMASVCTIPDVAARAKGQGCIQALLAGFSSHQHDQLIYQNFKDVIDVLGIDANEVQNAATKLLFWSCSLRETVGRKEIYKFAETIFANSKLEKPSEDSDAIGNQGKMTANGCLEKLLEVTSLLEAVAVSRELSLVMVQCDCVDSLLHTMACISATPMSTSSETSQSRGRPANVTISSTVSEKVLAHCCNILIQLTRLAFDVKSLGHSADVEERAIPGQVYKRLTYETIANSMQSQGKLSEFASSVLTLASWLAVGPDHPTARAHVEMLVTGGVIEGIVGILRAQQGNSAICDEGMKALSRIAGIGRGATAVATRGGSRQVIRMLPDAAASESNDNQGKLLEMLRVLEACAHHDEAVEILGRQGVVDAVTDCVQSTRAFALIAGRDASSNNYQAEVAEAIASLLGRLVGGEELQRVVQEISDNEGPVTSASQQYTSRGPLKIDIRTLERLPFLIRKFGLFVTTAAAQQTGVDTLRHGIASCLRVAIAAERVWSLDGWDQPSPNTPQEYLVNCLSTGLIAIDSTLEKIQHEMLDDCDKAFFDLLDELVPFLIKLCGAPVELSSLAISCLAKCLDCSRDIINTIGNDEEGLRSLVSALRIASERGMERLAASTMKVLSVVSRADQPRESLIGLELHSLVLNVLGDMVQEAGASAQMYALELLEALCKREDVRNFLISGGIFALVRSILQRHCSDPYNPSVGLLKAACDLLAQVLGSVGDAEEVERWTDLRTTLRRVCKSATCSTGYLDNAPCMVSALSLVSKTSDDSFLNQNIVSENAKVLIDSGVENLVVLAMSSSSSTNEVIEVGRQALVNLGLSSKVNEYIETINAHCDAALQWMNAGWTPGADEVQAFIRSIIDTLKNVSATVAGSDKSLIDSSLARSIFNAMLTSYSVGSHCRQLLKNVDTASRAQASNYSADLFGLSVQISGRLLPFAMLEESGRDEETVKITEIVGLAVDSLRQGALAVRVIESAVKSIVESVQSLQDPKPLLNFLVKEKAIYSMTRLLRIVRRTQSIRRISGKATGELANHSSSDLQKMESILQEGLQKIADSISAHMSEYTSFDSTVVLDGLLAASASQSPDFDDFNPSASQVTKYLDLLEKNPQLFEKILGIIPSSLRTVALRGGGAFSLGTEAEQSAHEKDSIDAEEAISAEGIQSRVRAALALVQKSGSIGAKRQQDGPDVSAGHVARLRSLFMALKSSENLIYGSGRVWRRKRWKKSESTSSDRGSNKSKRRDLLELFRSAVRQVISTIRVTHRTEGSGVTKSDFDERLDSELTQATLNGAQMLRDQTVEFLCNSDLSSYASALNDIFCSTNTVGDIMELLSSGESDAILSGMSLAEKILGFDAGRTPSREVLDTFSETGFFNLAAHSCGEDLSVCKKIIHNLNKVINECNYEAERMGLDAKALLIIQSSLRNFPEDEEFQRVGDNVITALSQVHSSQSGKAFVEKIMEMLDLYPSCVGVCRYLNEDGTYTYVTENGGKTDTIPENFQKFLESLYETDRRARVLDVAAVGAIDSSIYGRFKQIIDDQSHDPGIIGMCQGILGKIADSEDNMVDFANSDVVTTIIERSSGHLDDMRVAETFINCIQPLSFEGEYCSYLASKRVTGTIVSLLQQFGNTKSLFTGFPMSWPPPGREEENKLPLYVDETDTEAEEKNRLDVRFAKTLVQVLANLACANEVEYSKEGENIDIAESVIRSDGITVLSSLMRENMDDARLLEDVLCALSNIAFVSMPIQFIIGESCIDCIVKAMNAFSQDEFLFRMALRAIGNVTRLDENIMRVVGHGGISALVSGMSAHFSKPEVLELAADVVGNLASVDEKKVTLDRTTSILKECHANRSEEDSAEDVNALVSRSRSSKEAVCLILYDDEGPKALVNAMSTYNTNESLVIACLRALHYSSGSEHIVSKMIDELDLISHVILVMTSSDFNAELLRRGARVLGQILTVESARQRLISAGAPQVLLSAIETHYPSTKSEDEEKAAAALGLCSTSYSLLYEMPCQEVFDSVRELNSVKTSVHVLRDNLENVHFSSIIIEVLKQWCEEKDIAASVARLGLSDVLKQAAENAEESTQVGVLRSIIEFLKKVAASGENAKILLEGNIMAVVDAIIGGILEKAEADPEAETKLKYRFVVMEILGMFEKISANGRDDIINLLRQGMWDMLRNLNDAYSQLRSGGQEFYDRQTCELAEKIMSMCREHDIPRNLEKSLKGFRQIRQAVNPNAAGSAPHLDELQNVAAKSSIDSERAETIAMQLKSEDFVADLWVGNVVTPCSLEYLPSTRTLAVTPVGDKQKVAVEKQRLPVAKIRGISEGNPLGHKKKLIKRSAKKNRSFFVESEEEEGKIVHIECYSTEERDILCEMLRALSAKSVDDE